jgi:NADH dehydrogenase FAD-containing subunit
LEQQQKAIKYLSSLGVSVICNERIIDFDVASTSNVYVGSSGKLYSGFDKIFLTTGTQPNSSLFSTSPTLDVCVDTRGRIKVKPTLQIDHWKFDHIFAGGDVTNVTEEKTGYAATISGVCIARNICRMVKGKEPLKQGTKGTLAAPRQPLHGISSNGGIGKRKWQKKQCRPLNSHPFVCCVTSNREAWWAEKDLFLFEFLMGRSEIL